MGAVSMSFSDHLLEGRMVPWWMRALVVDDARIVAVVAG